MQDDNEEQLVGDSPPSSLSCSSSSSSETFLVGFVIVNIVGRQHYTGVLSGREMVGLVREPLNPYDGNAIRVLNMRAILVGHIERSSAAVLAPLIDSNLVTVEGIVPKTPEIRSRFRVPCQIHIFARIEAFPSVHSAISRGGLQLISDSNHSFTLSDAVIVKEKKVEKEVKNVDEIFKLVGADRENEGLGETLEPSKEFIKSELFSHQKEGLGWLVYRENSDELPPFWENKDGAYVNALTNHKTNKRPEPLRGGIFADDMGLGKTLTLISLIAINRSVNGTSNRNIVDLEEVEEGKSSVSVGEKSKKRKLGKQVSGSIKKRKVTDTHLDIKGEGGVLGITDVHHGGLPSKTTLIVCTPSVFSVWITQLEEHTKPGCLKVYMYYGERTRNAEELLEYDIVLTTYSTLAGEVSASPLMKIEWWRVILDEAHIIKNVSAGQSRAVTSLNAKRRWVVTGTPIQNGSFDLFSLMNFLRFEPFSIKSYWQSLVQRPLDQGDESGLTRLQVLMKTISLRRTKDNTLHGLPPKTLETCFVELSVEEREQYNVMEAEAKNIVQKYVSSGSVMRNYSTILAIILRLRQICNDIALCPSDIKSLLPSNNIEDVSRNPELLRKMVSILEDGDDLDCPICMSPPTKTIITCCAHIFCQACILKTLKCTNPSCPLCRHPLLQSDLFSAPSESLCSKDNGIIPSSGRPTSSKVSALLKLLLESRDENPATKSVVFSQFRKMLILLEEGLKAAGFNIMRLDGTMTAKRRANVIKEFGKQSSGSTTVLLASLKASGAGINLTAASRVYLLEPWWNPAVEEQAMDRIHRIGQKEHVKIVRLIARNTIENRILELQEKKKTLARDAFQRGGKHHREMGLDDFRILMSM